MYMYYLYNIIRDSSILYGITIIQEVQVTLTSIKIGKSALNWYWQNLTISLSASCVHVGVHALNLNSPNCQTKTSLSYPLCGMYATHSKEGYS